MEIRAGDADREATARLLGQVFTQGYLTMPEYEARLQDAFAATTQSQLRALTADLPLARRIARRQAARRSVRYHLAGYLTMVAVVLTVWLSVGLTTGAWYFWPIWPILGAGIGLVGHALPVSRYGSMSPARIA